MSLPDPQEIPLWPLWPETGEWLGIRSRSAAYDAANRGEIPTITIGARKLVRVADLRRMVHIDAD